MVCLSVLLFLGLCLSRLALADEPTPRATTQQVQQTVERAIGYLQTESAAWLNTRKCAACHHVPMPLWALSEAERQGYAIDKKFVADTTESLLGSKDKLMASKIFPNPADPPDPRPQGRGLNMGLPFLAVAARSLPSLDRGTKTKPEADRGGDRQEAATGRFVGVLRHPPATADQREPDHRRRLDHHGARGGNGARRAGIAAHGAVEGDRLARRRQALRPPSRQGPEGADGGSLRQAARNDANRRSTSCSPCNAPTAAGARPSRNRRATPLPPARLCTSCRSPGYTAERPEIKRGIDFLVATQKPDGSWPMISRSTPDGSPGSSKLLTPITCAASSWATLGLARLVPKTK